MKRVLVTIVGQGSITHIIRSGILEGMRRFCNPVVAILWNEESLVEELRLKGFEVYIIPAYNKSNAYERLRANINIWYLRKVLKTPSTKIKKRYFAQYAAPKKNIRKRIKWRLEMLKQTFWPGYISRILQHEKLLIKEEKSYQVFKAWLEQINVDGLYTVTPFLEEIELLARILNEKKLPVISSIHSFDNITVRGWPAFFFDHYIVWNKYNRAELKRINPKFSDADISIAGAPQFDFHFDKSFGQSKEQWRSRLNIPADKKVILYGGGPVSLLPNEPQYLKHLKEAFEEGLIDKGVVLLFRCHPLDKVERWKEYVGNSPFIIYDTAPNGTKKLDYTNVTIQDIDKLVSTLKYADVHINLCSTMTVDGSIFNKPQIGPAYDDINTENGYLLSRLYYQEHYLPIMKTKVVNLAKSKQQLVQLVNEALASPVQFTQACTQCVQEIITYTDGQSAKRVTGILKQFFS